MSDVILRARGIGKRYLRLDTPLARLRYVFGSGKQHASDGMWALEPLDFELSRGESLGIVGRNGSGKSTLLSIIAGILTPTTGSVEIFGRVAALLELGSGFNLDFTGRENAFFNGMLNGFSQAEMERRMPAIAEFAEIGDFIDRPVKTYSSGMFVRLAFSVAISVEPDIMIVDEALSVGDVFFQQKCFERLRQLRARGTTLLFVSHDSGAVYRFCDRAILLEEGRLVKTGSPKDVIETYEAALIVARDAASATPPTVASQPPEDAAASEPEAAPELVTPFEHSDAVVVEDLSVVDGRGTPVSVFVSESDIAVRVTLRFAEAFDDPHVGFKIRNRFGEVVFETNTFCMNQTLGAVAGGDRLIVSFPFRGSLHAGDYTVTLGVADGGYGEGLFRRQLVYRHDLALFKVLRNVDAIIWSGVVNLFPGLVVTRSSTDSPGYTGAAASRSASTSASTDS